MVSGFLRFDGAARHEPRIDQWFDARPSDLASIARQWFAEMRRCGPDVTELLHDGHPTACVGDAAFGYVNVFSSHVNIGFFHGASFADPGQLLQGTGRFMRHVKANPASLPDAASLTALIHTAYVDIKKRLAAERLTIYDAVGGIDGLLKLAKAWHHRVLEDEVVAHAFSHGYHPQHTERLAAYWAEALGGPAIYSDTYGSETTVVRRHSGNGPHEEMDRRAIGCFDQALDDIGLARNDRLWRALHDYFAWATHHTMARYHDSADDVPEGLNVPKWSWDGLVAGWR
jgi:hemoglobin